jgi:hypothetical protein
MVNVGADMVTTAVVDSLEHKDAPGSATA